MEAKKETSSSIIDQLKEYLETRVKLAKYEAIESGTSFVANLIVDLVMITAVLFTLMFASVTLAYFLGDVLNSVWKGFGCVTVLYIVLVLIVKYNKQSFEKPVINAFIKKIFKN